MAEKPEAQAPESTGDMRGQMVKRLAVAGVLVAILLGVLAFFDYLARTPEEDVEEAPVFNRPVPVAPKKEVSQPVTPASDLPAPPVAEPPPAAPSSEAPPAPQVTPTPAAAVEETKPEVRPVTRAEIRPASRSTAAVSRSASAPASVAEESAAPAMAPRKEADSPVVGKPSARVLEASPAPAPAPVVSQPALSRLLSGFLLQAGVFASPKTAEELHARLTLSGVPSTMETRVQVGPFRTRQEAEAAQQKLKALGVETILVPPKGAK